MKYYIAIDASGGKTESVLIDQTGKVLKHTLSSGANPLDIGAELASTRICNSLNDLKKEVPEDGKLAGVFCSVSAIHYFPYIKETIKKAAGRVPCNLESVVSPVLAAVLGKEEDCVGMISGTGSYCYVKIKGKENHYFGSSGYLLDIGGSAYTIAQQGLVAVLRELDGRGEKTVLTELVQGHIGGDLLEHLPVIYVGGREYIASFSHLVFEAWRKGDKIATKIIEDNANCYIESLTKAREMIGKPFKVAIGGGVFREEPDYVELVKKGAPKDCEFIMIDVPAVYGCALEALWEDNQEVPEDFKKNFVATM